MSLFDKIEKNRKLLNKNENYLLKYILENTEKVANMKIQDLSKHTFTSTATIVRFCKKLGYNGYAEFKANLTNSINKEGDKITKTNNDIFLFDDIAKTRDLINEDLIEDVLSMINKAHRIDFYGEGSSKDVCIDMSRKFQLVGKNCRYFNDSSIMYSTANDLDEGTLVFAISMSGETTQVIKAVNIAKTRGCKIISVTCIGYNTLANLSDRCVFVFSSEYKINNIKFMSRITVSAIMEYIFFKYLNKYSYKTITD